MPLKNGEMTQGEKISAMYEGSKGTNRRLTDIEKSIKTNTAAIADLKSTNDIKIGERKMLGKIGAAVVIIFSGIVTLVTAWINNWLGNQ